ncbi:MAG: class I SAM-dependent methyltransferase [Actinomycetota bacterium]|nr:class I SAM-dependent methyltransferase [Actinomycetota bacterium]
MTAFGNYARYYDLLYRDKDYEAEANYIHGLIQKYAPASRTILDLGCGTGRHDALLAQKGYTLHGVDVSESMLAEAEARRADLPREIAENLAFSFGDVREIRLGEIFDVVISLFHVLSYQVTNEDLDKTFATARAHLKPGGLFIFDCWYGPAVLTERPEVRIKELEDDKIYVTRKAVPTLYPNENRVDVDYHLFILDKDIQVTEEFREVHRMRYLFTPEVKRLSENNGMEIIFSCEWMADREPGFDTWSVCFGAR